MAILIFTGRPRPECLRQPLRLHACSEYSLHAARKQKKRERRWCGGLGVQELRSLRAKAAIMKQRQRGLA